MSYHLTFDQKSTYLHVVVTGRNTREAVAGYLAEVMRECAVRRCRWLLIEERLEGARLGTMDVFDVASKGTSRPDTLLAGVAYVDVNAEGDLMRFAEDVAVNRGFPVKVFSAVAAAEKWLIRESRRSTPKPASDPKRRSSRRSA